MDGHWLSSFEMIIVRRGDGFIDRPLTEKRGVHCMLSLAFGIISSNDFIFCHSNALHIERFYILSFQRVAHSWNGSESLIIPLAFQIKWNSR